MKATSKMAKDMASERESIWTDQSIQENILKTNLMEKVASSSLNNF